MQRLSWTAPIRVHQLRPHPEDSSGLAGSGIVVGVTATPDTRPELGDAAPSAPSHKPLAGRA